jgi:hypothetical protein
MDERKITPHRTLGMIPGLKPPEGAVEPSEVFSRLPTTKELHTSVKGWIEQRSQAFDGLKETMVSTATSANSLQKFTLTDQECQEFEEVGKLLNRFNKRELKLLNTDRDVAYYAAIYVHKETGLKIGMSNDQHVLHRTCVEVPKPSTLNVLKHVWVEAWYSGESCEYYVDNADDLRRLMSILNETESTDVRLVASEEFIRTAWLKL